MFTSGVLLLVGVIVDIFLLMKVQFCQILLNFLLSLKQPSVTQGSCQVFFAAGKNSKHISTYMYEIFSKL